ncbi:MAG TPA: peptide chain release factor N(5)-glutamine methyltransferase [Ignavibacteriaceae bacterium]|nr:peptide chain release factor N(5)-glutamine methyltransferase [Ignavibacteriaceae bacterium]
MLTVLEALKLSEEYLTKYNIDSSRLNAELLLADILNCKRLDLYLLYDKPLQESEIAKYRDYLKRRSSREPLQYIIGNVEFFGCKFFVDPSVLIPRPETELLVECALKKYLPKDEIRILDIGVGSGNIAVTLLKNLSLSSAVGIDINDDTLSVASKNAQENNVIERLELVKLNILKDDHKTLGNFDMVISNPPYISLNDFQNLEPELKNYEPLLSLTDNSDGYLFYEKIISISSDLLNNNGRLFFELGKDQHTKVNKMMIEKGFSSINIVKDYSDIERVIFGEK